MPTPHEFEVSTPPVETPDLVRPLARIFEEAERLSPDAPFLKSRSLPGEQLSFGQLAREARAVARHLVAAGVKPGDRVALLSENRPRWGVAYAAVLFADGIVVPLDASATPEALGNILGDSGARVVLVSDSLRPKLVAALRDRSEVREMLLDGDGPRTWQHFLASAPVLTLPALVGGDRPAALLYTSGTTGSPKGVILTQANLQAEIRSVAQALAFTPDDVLLMFLPLHHVLSQVGSFLLPASLLIRSVHVDITRGEQLVEAVREEGVTILLAVPQLFHLLHERILARFAALPWPLSRLMRRLMRINGWLIARHDVDLGPTLFASVHRTLGWRLRLMVSGGAPLSRAAQDDFRALGFLLTQAYGLTETSGGACFARPDDLAPGTVGKPLPGVTVRIDSPDAEGVGEICLRGAVITPGYYGRKDATDAVLRKGWLHTGDLGSLDELGNLRITGRSKDVIVLANGKNIYPEELESHYSACASVKEVCIVGRRASGDTAEKLHAVVVPDWDALKARGVTAVRDHVRFEIDNASLRLPSYQRVLSFELRREALPRTATRKLQRHLVTSQGGELEPRTALPADDADMAARQDTREGRAVAGLISRRVGTGVTVQGGSSFELDLGLDSLNRMELLLGVESALGIRISDDDAGDLHVVDDLVRLCLSKTHGGVQGQDADLSSWGAVLADVTIAELPDWLRPRRTLFGAFVVRMCLGAARLLALVLFRLRATGLENIPAMGPFLICPNHVSLLDGFVVACTFPRHVVRDAFVLGEREYITGRLRTPLARFFAVVPTDANRQLRQTMRMGAAGLKAGRILLLFPEGVRSVDGRLGEIKGGAPVLAAELGVPIVPVLIEGAFEAWPRGQAWPRPHPISVKYGKPLIPAGIAPSGPDERTRHDMVAAALRKALIELGAPHS